MNEYYINYGTDKHKTCWVCLSTNEDVRAMLPEEVIWYQTLASKALHDNTLNICMICGHLLKKYFNFTQQCKEASEVLTQMPFDHPKNFVSLKSSHNYCLITLQTVLCSDTNKETCFIQSKNGCSYQNSNLIFDDNDYVIQKANCDERFPNNDPELMNNESGTNNEEVFTNDTGITDNYFEIDNNDLSDDDELPLMLFSRNHYGTAEVTDNLGLIDDNINDKARRKKQKQRNQNNIEPEIKIEIKQESELDIQESCGKTKKKPSKDTRQGFSSRMVQETDEYLVIKLTKEQVLEEMSENSKSEKYKRALYKCDKCVKGFNFEEVLRGHMKKHTQESGELLCDICQQYCPSAVSMRGHMKSHTTRYKCKVCSSVRLSRQHLLEHYALSHTNSASLYSCQRCQFNTKKRTVIQRHVRTHTSEEKHPCEQCGRMFTSLASLRVHTTRHDKSKALVCAHCSRKFIYPSLLQRHVRAVHEQAEYYCVECDIRFKSPDNLRLHFKKAKRHRDPSSYTHECPHCNQKFISAATLAVHLTTTHGEPKSHACEFCSRLYSNKESLQGHVRRRHAKIMKSKARALCDKEVVV